MSYYYLKPAKNRVVLQLAFQETMFVAGWSALAGALFLPLTSFWIYTMIPAALISIHFLVSLELSGDGSPLVSLEIKQHPVRDKKNASRMAVYFRILLNVLLLPAALIGYIPLLFGKASLPEQFTGLRLVATDRRIDPRRPAVINGIVKKATIRIRTLTIVPLAAAAAAFFLLHSAPSVMSLQVMEVQDGLPEYEEELLTHYLELIALHPEELEYHVRLASLYYRNHMEQDLMNELQIIAEIDSTHAILMLADTTEFTFEMLEPLPADSSFYSEVTIPVGITTEALADSAATDSLIIQVDSTATDSLIIQVDSTELVTGADSLILTDVSADTVLIVPDTIPEEPADTLPDVPSEEEIYTPEEITEPVVEDLQETEEETVEPDTIIQP